MLWHAIDLPVPHAPWPTWRQELWPLLGLDKHRHHIVRAPMRFEQVVVPRPGFSVSEGLHPLQRAAIAIVPTTMPPLGNRVWLSRSALPEQFGRFLGEAALEARLIESGWTIVRPETITIAAQANIFGSADTVAGFAGSAFHAVMLCAMPRARLRIVRRPSGGTAHYDLVAQARGINQVHVDVPLRATGPLHAWTTFEIIDVAAAAQAVFAAAA